MNQRTYILVKKIRDSIIVAIGFIMFVGSQVVPATDTNETATFFEALLMGIIPMFLHFAMWSDYIYNEIREQDIKINYDSYQVVGLVIVIFTFLLVSTAY